MLLHPQSAVAPVHLYLFSSMDIWRVIAFPMLALLDCSGSEVTQGFSTCSWEVSGQGQGALLHQFSVSGFQAQLPLLPA